MVNVLTTVYYSLILLHNVYYCLLLYCYTLLLYFLIHTGFISRSFTVSGSLRSVCGQIKVSVNSPTMSLLPLHTPQALSLTQHNVIGYSPLWPQVHGGCGCGLRYMARAFRNRKLEYLNILQI